jgi:hypothetical protein
MPALRRSLPWLLFASALTVASPARPQSNAERPAAPDKPCNAAGAAIGGALIGALLGGKRGAAIGGALGATVCVAANYRAQKVRSAQEVENAYRQANGGQMPEHATLVTYESHVQPAARIKPGDASVLASYIEVAQGSDGIAPRIEEEITLVGPDGKTLKTLRKPANEGASSGAFQTEFGFTLPKGVREGQYEFRTAVLINGEPVREARVPLQVIEDVG